MSRLSPASPMYDEEHSASQAGWLWVADTPKKQHGPTWRVTMAVSWSGSDVTQLASLLCKSPICPKGPSLQFMSLWDMFSYSECNSGLDRWQCVPNVIYITQSLYKPQRISVWVGRSQNWMGAIKFFFFFANSLSVFFFFFGMCIASVEWMQ